MNELFAQYTTSVAFALQLSKRQCNELLRLHHKTAWIGIGSRVTTLRSLEAKGLVWWSRGEGIGATKFEGLTEAGTKVSELLVLACLTVENTETASTLRHAA